MLSQLVLLALRGEPATHEQEPRLACLRLAAGNLVQELGTLKKQLETQKQQLEKVSQERCMGNGLLWWHIYQHGSPVLLAGSKCGGLTPAW